MISSYNPQSIDTGSFSTDRGEEKIIFMKSIFLNFIDYLFPLRRIPSGEQGRVTHPVPALQFLHGNTGRIMQALVTTQLLEASRMKPDTTPGRKASAREWEVTG